MGLIISPLVNADTLDNQHGEYYLDFPNATNKTSPVISLSGDLSGSTTLTNLASSTFTLNASIAANSVVLGTDTTGNYVAGVTAGNGVSVTGTAEEGWSPTITLDTPGTLSTSTTNNVTVDSHTHAITTTSTGAANTIVATGDLGNVSLGNVTAASVIKSGGTSSQFLKADGSVDSNTYSTTSHNHNGTYAPVSHVHGNITNAGAIGTTSDLLIKTTTNGVLTTLSAGVAGQFLQYDGTWAIPNYGIDIKYSTNQPTGQIDGDIWYEMG